MKLSGVYDASSVELQSASGELHALAQAIRGTPVTQEFLFPPALTPPHPYDGHVTSLRIVTDSGKVSVSRSGGQVAIRGSPEMLAILAWNVDVLAYAKCIWLGGKQTYHIHIEYYQGHFYLEEGSVPLVLTNASNAHGPNDKSIPWVHRHPMSEKAKRTCTTCSPRVTTYAGCVFKANRNCERKGHAQRPPPPTRPFPAPRTNPIYQANMDNFKNLVLNGDHAAFATGRPHGGPKEPAG